LGGELVVKEHNPDDEKKPLGHLDPAKGGRARAEKLTPEERQEIARKAAAARWGDGVLKVAHGSPDHPLKIGAIELPCYVLSDESRVVTQQGLIEALGMSRGGAGGKSGSRLTNFVSGQTLKPYFPTSFDCGMTPIKFQTPEGGFAYGYPATILADICEAVLAARSEGNLHHNQQHIAKRCEILLRGFARVGIIALVDAATGYQQFRARRALEEILERFISQELARWAKMFPDEFYEQMFRLKNWKFNQIPNKRPVQAGKLTNDLVYQRLAPGVLEELKRITPRGEKGRLKHKYFQRLTEDVGHPRLREHLSAILALMRAADEWSGFYRSLNRALPKQVQCPLIDWAESGQNVAADEEGRDGKAESPEPKAEG
jgi:hypothetical protein